MQLSLLIKKASANGYNNTKGSRDRQMNISVIILPFINMLPGMILICGIIIYLAFFCKIFIYDVWKIEKERKVFNKEINERYDYIFIENYMAFLQGLLLDTNLFQKQAIWMPML